MTLISVHRLRPLLSRRLPAVTAVAMGAVLLAACKPAAVSDPNDPKFVVAQKGDNWQITKDQLDAEVGNFLKERHATAEQVGPAKMPMVQTAMLKNMVLKKMFLDRAATLDLKDLDKAEAEELDRLKGPLPETELETKLKAAGMSMDDLKQRIHERVVMIKVLQTDAFKNTDPTDEEINDFYLKNKASITTPPQVRASRILVHLDEKMTPEEKAAKKKIIDKAYARVAHGEEFSKVAMEMSEDRSSSTKGGDLDFFQPNENESGFDVVAFSTKKGAVSPVFETSLGYQFLKVTDTKAGGEVPLADVRPKIAAYLKQQKMEKESEEYTAKLLADPSIKWNIALIDPSSQMMNGQGAGANPPPADANAQAPSANGGATTTSAPPPPPESAPAPSEAPASNAPTQ